MYNFNFNVEVKEEEVMAALEDGFECGNINYWCGIDNDNEEWREAKKQVIEEKGKDNYFIEDIMLHLLKNSKKVRLYDAEEDTPYSFNLQDLLEAIVWNKLNYENNYEDWDSEDGDRIIQYACFKDVLFG